MHVRFRERMRGSVRGPNIDAPLELELEALGGPAIPFLHRGRTHVVGTLNIPGLASESPIHGRLDVELIPGRRIAYDLHFVADDGEALRFYGEKRVGLTHPIDGMTKLEAFIARGETVLASGPVEFDLRDLPSFLASWSLESEGAWTRSPGSRDLETLFALAEAMIPKGDHVPLPDGQTFSALEAYLQDFPLPLAAAYSGGLSALEAIGLARRGTRFSRLTVEDRTQLVEDIFREAETSAASLIPARLIHLLSSSIKLIHFARDDYARAIGHPNRPMVSPEARPRWHDQVTDARELDPTLSLEAEVVIVGTGAGGGALAKELAERGVAVLILEEGGFQSRSDYSGPPVDRLQRIWRDRGLTFTIGEPSIIIPLGRTVGGTTAINSGTCFRTPDRVLLSWVRDKGLPEDFLPERFARAFERVEAELEVSIGAPKLCGAIGEVVAEGARTLGLEHGPLPRNAPACDAQAECILGCPTGAKRSTDVSYVPRALKAGAQLLTHARAERLVMKGDRVLAIEVRAGERRLLIRGRAFALSMGALLTPTFLAGQELPAQLPRLGKNLSVHPALGLVAELERDMEPWHAIPQGYGFSGFEHEGICFEGFYLPPALFPPMLPLAGRQLTWWMDRFRHLGQFGFMVKDSGVGRVTRGPDGKPLIFYSADDSTLAKLRRGISVLAEVLIRGGARKVLTGAIGVPPVTSVSGARALDARPIRAGQLAGLGAHPLGTCALGPGPDSGVVDFEHRVFGTENLYVVDGSSVPTSLGVNPQMTIMAMATRAAEILATRVRD